MVGGKKFKKVEGYDEPLEIWELPKMSPKKQREHYVPESFEHRARMDVLLCRKIIEEYTEPGELILDPMAGIGTTLVEGALLNHDVIGVELEKKYVEITKKNIEKLERYRTLAPKGKAIIIHGDSRHLSQILAEKVDSAVFSPPYFIPVGKVTEGTLLWRIMNGKGRYKDTIGGTKSYVPFTQHPDNIHKLRRYGNVDSIVSSPPYGTEGFASKDKNRTTYFRQLGAKVGKYTRKDAYKSPHNIANLKYVEIEAIVCSPPYGDSVKNSDDPERLARAMERRGWGNHHTPGRLRGLKVICSGYSDNKDNIGNLPYGKIGAILSSPPYSEGIGHQAKKKGGKYWRYRELNLLYTGCLSKDNIARLKHGDVNSVIKEEKERKKQQETYLEAMYKIYCECFKVLKPGGKMVLVVRPFYKNKKLIRLDLDTRKLCELAGFRFLEAKLVPANKSVWRHIYEKKNPKAKKSLVNYEFVLVFEKPAEREVGGNG